MKAIFELLGTIAIIVLAIMELTLLFAIPTHIEAPITPYLTIAFIVNGTLIAGLIFYNMDCKNTGDAYFIFFSAGIISILLILLLSAHLEAMP